MVGTVALGDTTSLESAGSTLPLEKRWWLISRLANGRVEMLTTRRDAVTLPIFSFEEEAGLFLELEGLASGGWRVRESRAGEITSVLYDPYIRVARVALDPLPQKVASVTAMLLTSMDRRAFLDYLLRGETAGGASRIHRVAPSGV